MAEATFNRKQLVAVNRWRQGFNPLRGLTIQRAVSLLEAGDRGEYADLQWTYHYIEQTNPTLLALVERRLAALSKLDWSIKTLPKEELPPGATLKQAEAQRDYLRNAYEKIDNLWEAIEELELAKFRGFALLERQAFKPGGTPISPRAVADTTHFAVVPQWHWIRDGLYGEWKYNADARSVTGRGAGAPIDPTAFIVRECARPINRVALILTIRKSLATKDWDAFVDLYGLANIIIVGPPNVPPGKETEYETEAGKVAAGGSGYLPNGSDVKNPTADIRGTQPFQPHAEFQDAQLVLAGTGGKLTMLTDATGIGQGATGAHEDAFDDLAAASAQKISEAFQTQFDAPLRAEKFPGQPMMAWFEIGAVDKEDATALTQQVAALTAAGYRVEAGQISERTGWNFEKAAGAAAPAGRGAAPGQFDPESDIVIQRRRYLDSLKEQEEAATSPAAGAAASPAVANRRWYRRAWDWLTNREPAGDAPKFVTLADGRVIPIDEDAADAMAVRSRFSDGTRARFKANLATQRHHKDIDAVSDARFKAMEKRIEDMKARKVWDGTQPEKKRVAGFVTFDQDGKATLHADGPDRQGVYAHEVGHVIDGADREFSGSGEWKTAWKSEARKLSAYAGNSPADGFAEFCRALHTTDRDALAKKLPKSYAFWREKGLL